MRIVVAASECTPFAKTGGLADVVGALPPELVKLGHEVTVYLPLYTRVRKFLKAEPEYAVRSLTIPFRYYNRFVGVVNGGKRDGVQYYFIEFPELFDRQELYGPKGGDYSDNAERFGLFCRAVIEATKIMGVPEVFHVHDWQAATDSGVSADNLRSGSGGERRGQRADDSQRRISREVSAEDHGAVAVSVGHFHDGQGGAVRPLQFSEGSGGVCRPS